jgi:chaperone BCS1
MTTNHIERLDDALIRPGRVDRKVLFRRADKSMIFRLFCTVFKQSDDDYRTSHTLADDETVERLADEFVSKVPEQEFSPAEILSFLLERKRSPTDAVADAKDWVNKTREDGSKLKRENSWVV